MSIIGAAMVLASCGEKKSDVVVTETRALTTKDSLPKLSATDDERFSNAIPSPVRAFAPESWLAVPATKFRQLNYRFGTSGTGEVFVSVAGGSLLDNANRWLGQFQAPALTPESFAALEKLPMLGSEGIWLEAAGTYAAGMGQAPREAYGLAGVMVVANQQLISVKMVGPAAEVAAEHDRLRAFVATVSFVE